MWVYVPVSFNSTDYAVVDTPYFESAENLQYVWEITNKEQTRFHAYSLNAAQHYYAHWIAIGY